MSYSTVSIGYFRDDGDFHILATLNNNDEIYSDEVFYGLVEELRYSLHTYTDDNPYSFRDMIVLERQDAPDYLTIIEIDFVSGHGI